LPLLNYVAINPLIGRVYTPDNYQVECIFDMQLEQAVSGSNIFGIRQQSVDVVLFLIRIVVGIAFAIFAWGKIQQTV